MPIWTPLYAWAIYLLFKKYGSKIWQPLLIVGLMILFSDQTCNFLKHSVQRYRPTHNLEISQYVHIVAGYKGGLYGFVSAHAANTAAFCTFLLLTMWPMNKRNISLFICWVFLVGLSRIYLGVHYPADVFGGYAIGIFFGILSSRILPYFSNAITKNA